MGVRAGVQASSRGECRASQSVSLAGNIVRDVDVFAMKILLNAYRESSRCAKTAKEFGDVLNGLLAGDLIDSLTRKSDRR